MGLETGAGSGEMRSTWRPRRWWDSRLFTPGWSADQHPDLNETVPAGWQGLDMVALGCAALVVGLGLRTCALRAGPEAAPGTPRAAATTPAATPPDDLVVSRP